MLGRGSTVDAVEIAVSKNGLARVPAAPAKDSAPVATAPATERTCPISVPAQLTSWRRRSRKVLDANTDMRSGTYTDTRSITHDGKLGETVA